MLTPKERADRRWARKRQRLVCRLLDADPKLTSYEALRLAEQKLRDAEARKGRGPGTPAAKEVFCATCGAVMVRRPAAKSGRPFWGCPAFPKCSFTLPIVGVKSPELEGRKVRQRSIERDKLAADLMAARPGLKRSKALWLASRILRSRGRGDHGERPAA